MIGTLYGVGVGPGDPELLTLKAARIIRKVPVIAYPAPETGPSLAHRIATPHLPSGQVEIVLRMPMSAEHFPADTVYDRAAHDIGGHLADGRDVAFLCEGDPFFYGSFLYLFARMAAEHRVEVVPGVSSLTACAAVIGAPLTARNDILTVIPAPLPDDLLADRLSACDAAAIIKVGRHFERVRAVLLRLGMIDRAHYVERATMDSQRVVPASAVSAESVPYFSMIIVHRRGAAFRL